MLASTTGIHQKLRLRVSLHEPFSAAEIDNAGEGRTEQDESGGLRTCLYFAELVRKIRQYVDLITIHQTILVGHVEGNNRCCEIERGGADAATRPDCACDSRSDRATEGRRARI